MSEYSYDDRPRRRRTTREREPEYVTETTYVERGGKGPGVRDLVYRPAREDSIEDIPRDFPPPGTEYRQTKYRETYEPRRTRSSHRDYGDDYSYAGRYDRGRRPRDYDDYSDDDYRERPKPSRRKSIVDNVKEIGEAAGLGGIIGAVSGRSRSRSRHRRDRYDDRGYDSERYGYDDRDRRSRRYSSSERSRSRSRGGGRRKTNAKWEQAAKAAIVAGAVEAFRSRNTPGPWTGAKGQRIATAALGAAGIDSLVDKDPDKHGKRHVAESAIGGLLANRLANGSRSRSRGPPGEGSPTRARSRSRSRSIFGRSRSRGRSESRGRDGGDGNTLGKLAGGGAVLAAGKALYDRVRSKSRSRRDRSRSVSSEDSYVPSRSRRNRAHSRGRSMDTYSEATPRANPDRRLATAAGAGAVAAPQSSSKGKYESSDSESTTDMEQKRKKMRGKELLTAGLATVATIHAAHGVYSSMVASEKRRKMVSEGEMTPEEARKRKSKNMLQDAAAVGIAALGIKSAFSEWKEMQEQRHTVHDLERRRRKRRKARELREKEARQNALGGQNGMANPYAYPVAANPYPPTTYADANPYGAVPPPPIGAPPSARY
ncbi:hypothetical protein BS50DRAFT_606646 [Corynespora cassiicola Philippines]|uniref:DUF3824 domain-containing protein n=1 Tax=Corynespora cassiicola Philippines TaxID=1448308 RepID=A0A2T2P506_CORCC|nr:hypothetical protein BS50DRAFT_606646 [Corynespora cassiicola Philippines]